ncbi:hypothetical protein KCMC57_up57650 [Kitasatospora sp. CMC57]|uniref:Uncharacterized protein n=1 Tax=Kitasatospora sp. CMC57 TaxID=3231513 RepID=A0AB33K1I1_9ACTN
MTDRPDAGQLRLRPGVAVTPLREGLHLRGRTGSLTLEGNRSLPALWQALSARLGSDPGTTAVVPPKVAAALTALTDHLRAHDLVVDPLGDAELPPWPGAVAARPQEAVAALAAAHPTVASADPGGPVARAVARALTRGGGVPTLVTDPALATGQVLVVAGEPPVAVGLQCDPDGGFVTEPAAPERARADLAALAERLREDTGAAPAGTGTVPRALPLLLAGATAQRLLCAVAGLPDPARAADPRLLPGRPAVLVTEARPLRAEHRPWAAGPGTTAAPPANLETALRRIAALGDRRLGVFDAPAPGALPQLPAALVSCRTPDGTLVAGAPRTDLARLAGAVRAAELRWPAAHSGGAVAVVVGADPRHAEGRALRRAALSMPGVGDAGTAPADALLEHPQTRHWTTTLNRQLRREVELTVRQITDGAFLATVEGSRAVEATAADAVTVAAIGALTRLTARTLDLAAVHHSAFSGAAAPLAAAGQQLADWTDEGWTSRWISQLADNETDLQIALSELTGLRTTPWQPGTGAAHPLGDALAGCGFTVLIPTGGRR